MQKMVISSFTGMIHLLSSSLYSSILITKQLLSRVLKIFLKVGVLFSSLKTQI